MKRKVWFSPLLLWVALSPAFLQQVTCVRGNADLASLELEVDGGPNLIVGFDAAVRSYDVSTSGSRVTVRADALINSSTVNWVWRVGGVAIGGDVIGVDGGEVTLPIFIPDGQSELGIAVRAGEGTGTATALYKINITNLSNAVTKTIPMYCTVTGYGYGFEGTDFHLSVEALDPVIATEAFQAEISGHVRPILQDQVNFIDLLTTSTPVRVAIIGGGISAGTRSGATGPDAVLQVASPPTTCWADANGNTGFGAGPYPSCDPANDTGDGGNTDCIGVAGVPFPLNSCLPFRELTLIDGTQDACAACDAHDGPWLTTGCATSGYCAALSDPWFALEPEVATFTADSAAEALFGFEESLFPTEYPQLPDGFTLLMVFDSDPSQASTNLGGEFHVPIECFMGALDGVADPNSGPSPTQVPDADLVSIPISPCTDIGGTCANGILDACEECDDGNLIDGDGCQSDCTLDFCASDPIDCSAPDECVLDGVCDRLCQAGTGCNRCRGGGFNQPDGLACAGGDGSCQVGACYVNYCESDPVDCSASSECLTSGSCARLCKPGTGCDRCPGQDDPVTNGISCDGGDGFCIGGACQPRLLPCTEQGILTAISVGSGPYTFDCAGPTTVSTSAEIVVNNDVVLDGGGNLTIDAGGTHRVFDVLSGVTAELRGLTITGGSADLGAGVRNNGDLTIADCTIENNAAGAYGGGIHSDAGNLILTDSVLRLNSAGTVGGGLSVFSSAATLIRVTIEANSAVLGGGIYNYGSLTLQHSVVALNTGLIPGIDNFGSLYLRNSTIYGNSGGSGVAALLHETGAYAELTNVTISGNEAGIDTHDLMIVQVSIVTDGCAGSVPINGLNSNIESPGDSCYFDLPNISAGALNLGPFQDNGGRTRTLLPGPGSVAIDQTGCAGLSAADQRGISRPQGSLCDIGAVEVEQP